MRVVIREYSGKGASDLFDVLKKNTADIEKMLRQVAGLVSYTLARTPDGGYSVTVCEDQAGIDQSVEIARHWIAENAPNTGAAAPKISAADVIMHVK